MKRRDFLQMMGGAAIAAAGVSALQAAETKPSNINVLFIQTDQQVWKTLGVYGNKQVKTPHLDRLAKEGALFHNAFVTTPYCSPTRSSFVTGNYPHTTGIVSNTGRSQPGLDPAKHKITEQILFDKGYVTSHIGKWHIGNKKDYKCYNDATDVAGGDGDNSYVTANYSKWLDKKLPKDQFDGDKESDCLFNDRPVYMIAPIKAKWRTGQANLTPPPNQPKSNLYTLGKSAIPADLSPESYFTNKALKEIEANKDKRWMLTLSLLPPHAPFIGFDPFYSQIDWEKIELPGNWNNPPEWIEKTAARGFAKSNGEAGMREFLRIYYTNVMMIDHLVGRLMEKLDETGQADRTLIIFVSDHGDMAASHGAINKSVRHSFYEELVHVPLIMRLPKQIPAGTEVKEFASAIDIMPTVLDYAGVELPGKVDGRSVRALIEKRAKDWPDYVTSERTDPGAKGVQRMFRTHDYKYNFYTSRKAELFDLKKDPEENENLFDDPKYKKTVEQYHARLREWMKETRDPWLSEVPENIFALKIKDAASE